MPPVESWQKYQPLSEMQFSNSPSASSALPFCAQMILKEVAEFKSRVDQIEGIAACICISHDTAKELQKYYTHTNAYLLIISDVHTKLPYNFVQILQTLDDTGAPAFFFGLDASHFRPWNEPINYAPFKDARIEYRYAPLNNGMIAWSMEYETYLWSDPDLYSMVLLAPGDYDEHLFTVLADGNRDKLAAHLRTILAKNRDVALMYKKMDENACADCSYCADF